MLSTATIIYILTFCHMQPQGQSRLMELISKYQANLKTSILSWIKLHVANLNSELAKCSNANLSMVAPASIQTHHELQKTKGPSFQQQ
jgi:hypothetical protein